MLSLKNFSYYSYTINKQSIRRENKVKDFGVTLGYNIEVAQNI